MQTSQKKRDPKNSLGFFVDLTVGTGDAVYYQAEQFMPYRMMLTIFLPPGMKERWVNDICRVIRQVEGRNAWPIRFEKANLSQFITMADMEMIANRLPELTTYVYGVPQTLSFDEDTYRRWHNSALRTAYVKASSADEKRQMA